MMTRIGEASHQLHEHDLLQLASGEYQTRYKVLGKLGSGAFADVLHVRDLSTTQDMALKVLQPSGLHPAGIQAEVALFREARALKHAKHPNVVELLNVLHVSGAPAPCRHHPADSRRHNKAVPRSKQQQSCWGLLLEHMQGGSLSNKVYKQMVSPLKRVYSDMDALTWAVDIATGLVHLHSLTPSIIHRDLKLENILLKKPAHGSQQRKLPIAKISDFGLHVMVDVPRCQLLTTTEDGNTVLLLDTTQTTQTSSAVRQHNTTYKSTDQLSSKQIECTETVDTPKLPNTTQGPDGLKASNCGAKDIRTKHVTFDDSVRAVTETPQDQQLHMHHHENDALSHTLEHNNAAIHTTCWGSSTGVQSCSCIMNDTSVDDSSLAECSTSSSMLQEQQQCQWQPLTTSAIRRLSLEAAASNLHNVGSGMSSVAVPVVLRPSSSKPDSVRSFCRASIPDAVLQRTSPSVALLPLVNTAEAAAAESAVPDGSCAVCLEGRPRSAGIAQTADSSYGAVWDEAFQESMIGALAAANEERDYQVSLLSMPASVQGSKSRRSSLSSDGSSMHSLGRRPAAPVLQPAAPLTASTTGGSACGASSGGYATVTEPSRLPSNCDTGSCCGSASGLADYRTAASRMWEEIICKDLGTDDGVASSSSSSSSTVCTPLAFDLTQHTGSCMYMAPETYKGEPYNEAVDIFSFGVILYELFSRSLLLYTHTAASSPADCMKYAAKVASGFRPARPKHFHPRVWQIVECCWAADPCCRPSAAWVMQQLQQLLDVELTTATAFAGKCARQNGFATTIAKGKKIFKAFLKSGA